MTSVAEVKANFIRSIEEFPLVTTPEIFSGNTNELTLEKYGAWRFHPRGMFSSIIFGPLFDYTCDCNKLQPPGYTCELCGVQSKPSLYRNKEIAQVKLVEPIIHPFVFYVLYHNHFNLNPSKYVYYENGQIIQDTKIPTKTPMHPLLIFLAMYAQYKNIDYQELVASINKRLPKYFDVYSIDDYMTVAQKIFSEIKNKALLTNLFDDAPFEKLVLGALRLLPAGLRQINLMQFDAQKVLTSSEINMYYYKILKINTTLQNIEPTSYQSMYLYYMLIQTIQNYFETLIQQITKKKGIIRRYRLGRRINFSHRAVLVGDPLLKYDELITSYVGGLHLLYLHVIKELIKEMHIEDADEMIENALITLKVNPKLKSILDKIVKENNIEVLYLRQPVLHLPSTMKAKLVAFTDDLVIKTNQLVWSGLNADSDGDTFCLFYTDKINDNFKTSNHLYTPRGEFNFAIEYDSILGWSTL